MNQRLRIWTLFCLFLLGTIPACTTRTTAPNIQPDLAAGFAALRQEDWPTAQAAFTAVLNQQPENQLALTGRGQAQLEQAAWDTAVADFSTALTLNPQDAAAWAGRGRANLELAQYQAAVTDLSQAIQLAPLRASSYLNRGLAYYRQQQYELAIADFSRAIRSNHQAVRPYYWRGLAYHHLGDDALAAADMVQVADSQGVLADSARRRLEEWQVPILSPAMSTPAFTHSFSLSDLGQDDLVVGNIFDQLQVHFVLAEGQEVTQAQLELVLQHHPALLPGSSDLTLALNDEPIAELPLSAANSGPITIPLELPAAAFRPGDNVLLFRFNLRLDETGCSDAHSPDLWARVLKETAVSFNTTPAPLPLDLGRFPAPFSTLSPLAGSPLLTLLLPTNPTDTELSVAAQIAAALGQAAQWPDPPVQAITVDQWNDTYADNHLIAIDTAGRNTLAQGAASGISVQNSPYNANRQLWVVSGEDTASLQRAANLLTTRSAWGILHDAYTAPIPVTAQPPVKRPSRAAFVQLGFTDAHLRGIGPHDLYYPIDIPYNWKITSEADLELHFSHAPNMASRSDLAASINGFRVATIPLTNRNDDDGRLLVQLSPRHLHPGRNWLHLHFDLHLKQEDCNFRYLEEAWADVSAAYSTMNLSHVTSEPPLELRYLPSPLVTPANLSQNLFVLADQPTAAELTAMVQVAAKLGTTTQADGLRPLATTTASFSPDTAVANHIIAIGKPTTHPLLTTYNADLPFPLLPEANLAQSEWLELLPEAAETPAGYLQLLPAPWSTESVLIVVSGVDDEALLQTTQIFPAAYQHLNMQGNVAVVSGEKVTDLSLRGLAGTSLSPPARLMLSTILIGSFTLIGSLGWGVNRRRKSSTKPTENKTPIEG